MASFCKKYPKLWSLKRGEVREKYIQEKIPVEEREEIREKLEIVDYDYDYIYSRILKGRFNQEDFNYLKEAGVGRVFGVESNLENVIEKFSVNEEGRRVKRGTLKYQLTRDIKEYKNMNDYREKYIHSLIKDEEFLKNPEESKFYVRSFDLSKPDMIDRGGSFYDRVLSEFVDLKNKVLFWNGDKAEEIEKIITLLSEKKQNILKLRFGYDTNSVMTMKEVGDALGVSHQSIKQHLSEINSKLNKPILDLVEQHDFYDKEKEDFIREYVKNQDIFIKPDVEEMSDSVREELTELYQRGVSKIQAINNFKQRYYVLPKECQINIFEKAYNNELKINTENNEEILVTAENLNTLNNSDYKNVIEKMYENHEINSSIAEYEESFKQLYGNKSIEEIGFSNRVLNAFRKNNIDSIEAISKMSLNQLKNLNNLGAKSVEEVINKVHSFGLHFADEQIDKEFECQELNSLINDLKDSYKLKNAKMHEWAKTKSQLTNEFKNIKQKLKRDELEDEEIDK